MSTVIFLYDFNKINTKVEKYGKMICYDFAKWAASWQNQQNGMCAQRRIRSAWASAQSDQSLRCPHKESFGL